MNRLGSYDQLNTAYGSFFCVENMPSAKCRASCQAHCVVKAAFELHAMCAAENVTNYLCQSTVPFHNPFNNSAYKKRSVTVIYSRPEEDRSFDLLVREKPLNNDQARTLVAGNKPFSIQSVSSTGRSTLQSPSAADNNPYPIETPSQNFINTFYKAAIPVAIIGPKANIPRLQQCDVHVENKIGSSSDLTMGSEETSAGSRSEIMHKKERQRKRQRERQRERYHNDPAYAQRQRERQRERQRKLYRNPAYAKRQRERQRARRKERYQNDPVYAECQRKRNRDRYQNDPAFAERKRKQNRDRYQNDPVYAERQRIHNNAYSRIKRKLKMEEAAKIASVARQQYFQLVNSPENSGNLPQTPNQAEVTPNPNSN